MVWSTHINIVLSSFRICVKPARSNFGSGMYKRWCLLLDLMNPAPHPAPPTVCYRKHSQFSVQIWLSRSCITIKSRAKSKVNSWWLGYVMCTYPLKSFDFREASFIWMPPGCSDLRSGCPLVQQRRPSSRDNMGSIDSPLHAESLRVFSLSDFEEQPRQWLHPGAEECSIVVRMC